MVVIRVLKELLHPHGLSLVHSGHTRVMQEQSTLTGPPVLPFFKGSSPDLSPFHSSVLPDCEGTCPPGDTWGRLETLLVVLILQVPQYLVGGGQGCCQQPTMHRAAPRQGVTQPPKSLVPGRRHCHIICQR